VRIKAVINLSDYEYEFVRMYEYSADTFSGHFLKYSIRLFKGLEYLKRFQNESIYQFIRNSKISRSANKLAIIHSYIRTNSYS